MKVSIEAVHPYEKGSMHAFCNLVLDDAVVIKGCRIMDGKYGIWVAFPSRKTQGKDPEEKPTWDDQVIVLDKGVKTHINNAAAQAWAEHAEVKPPAEEVEPATVDDDETVPF